MSFIFSLALALAAVVVSWRLWCDLEDREDAGLMLWFGRWLGQGVVLPLIVWEVLDWLWVGRMLAAAKAAKAAAMAAGWFPGGVPVMPSPRDFLAPEWPRSGPEALVFFVAVWACINFLWLIGTALRQLGDRRITWWVAGVLGFFCLPVAAVIGVVLGGAGVFWAAAFWLGALAHVFVSHAEVAPTVYEPAYGGAVGHLKLGRFEQAEEAILEQLEAAEDDYTGWMLLAELYATHFRDLPTADRTVRDLCAQPNVNASQVSAALQKLADWYLAVDENPVAARSVLEEIELRYPNTHLAFMARQRLGRLPASRAEWQASKQAATIRLRPGAAPATGFTAMTACDAETGARRAELLAAHLQKQPADARAREELARLLEGPLQQPEAAQEHLRQLLARRDSSKEQRGEWLNLLAAWQLRHQRDGVAGRQTCDQIIREHAGTAAADQAAKRLQLLAVEERLRGGSARPPGAKRPGPIRVEVPRPKRADAADMPPPPAKWD